MIITEEHQLPPIIECNKWHSKHHTSQMLVEEMNQLHHTAHNTTQVIDPTTQLTTRNNGLILLPDLQDNTERFCNETKLFKKINEYF